MVAPHLPQPETDEDALRTLHEARVRAKSVPDRMRAYSLAWLQEREIERVEPHVVAAVGAASKSVDPGRKRAVEDAMARAAMRCMEEGMDLDRDAAEIKRRMLDARAMVHMGRVSV